MRTAYCGVLHTSIAEARLIGLRFTAIYVRELLLGKLPPHSKGSTIKPRSQLALSYAIRYHATIILHLKPRDRPE